MNVVQPCGTASLLSVILGKPLTEMFLATGLKLCPWCNGASQKPGYYPFCNNSCLFQSAHQKVPLECSECGDLFLVRKSFAMARINRSQSNRLYCSRQCQGAWFGRNHGGGRRNQTHCKRGHEMTPENTYTHLGAKVTEKACKACITLRSRLKGQQRKQEKLDAIP